MLKTIPAIAAVVLASALVIPTVSQAAENSSVRVSYADLNLAVAPGQQVLQQRIGVAARLVCEYEDSRQLEGMIQTDAAINPCRSDAVRAAQPAFQAAVAAAQHPSVTVLESAAIVVSAH